MPAVVQSLGALTDVDVGWAPSALYGRLRLYNTRYYDYATLYRTQPNVRTCVDFLARNIAQLGLHVFRRVSDTDRKRLRDHPLAKLLGQPLPASFKMTRYQLIQGLMADLGVYFNAFWLKVKTKGPMGLLRIPPPYVAVKGGLVPTGYEVTVGGKLLKPAPDELVHFRGYNAASAILGLSPLETLRRVLAEEHAAGDYRESFWANAARMGGIIERPTESPAWSETARERFKAEFEALYSGSENSGKTAILEEGMTWKPNTFNAQESEYLTGRKLTREECARAYHIPLPMVGILEHATFSNIREQHKNLYQDSLGPWLAMIEQDIEMQLLPEFAGTKGVYVEFNIAEKLQGSFDEQTKALQSAVGRPWMTADEARARMNLPSMGGDAEELVTPLNVLVGGQASPRDSAPPKAIGQADAVKATRGRLDTAYLPLRERHEAKWIEVLSSHFRRQGAAISSRVTAKHSSQTECKQFIGEIWFDGDRWNEELGADLLRLNLLTAGAWGERVATELELEEFDEDRMLPWLSENARIAAEEINATTRDRVADALTDAEREPRGAIQHLFELALSVRAAEIARSKVTTAANFGSQEAARQGGLKTKTWQVNSANPREDHAALDETTVGIGELFPNGMRWPGDPSGGAEQVANCLCSVSFA